MVATKARWLHPARGVLPVIEIGATPVTVGCWRSLPYIVLPTGHCAEAYSEATLAYKGMLREGGPTIPSLSLELDFVQMPSWWRRGPITLARFGGYLFPIAAWTSRFPYKVLPAVCRCCSLGTLTGLVMPRMKTKSRAWERGRRDRAPSRAPLAESGAEQLAVWIACTRLAPLARYVVGQFDSSSCLRLTGVLHRVHWPRTTGEIVGYAR